MFFSTATLLAIVGAVSASPLMPRATPFTGRGNIFPGQISGDFQSVLTAAGLLTVDGANAGVFTAVRIGNSVTLYTSAGHCATTSGVFGCGAGVTPTTYQVSQTETEGTPLLYLSNGGQGTYVTPTGASPGGSDTVPLHETTENNGETAVYALSWQGI